MDNLTEPLVQIVDKTGAFKGVAGKIEAHLSGSLHLAFSAMCFREGENEIEYLIQQRATGKYHSGGLWSNTCCSHPFPGESLDTAVNRRLVEEIGMVNSKPLFYVGSVIYHFELDNNMQEHEFDHIYLVDANDSEFVLNPNEVQKLKWVPHNVLKKEIVNHPEKFTKWLPVIWEKIHTAKIKTF